MRRFAVGTLKQLRALSQSNAFFSDAFMRVCLSAVADTRTSFYEPFLKNIVATKCNFITDSWASFSNFAIWLQSRNRYTPKVEFTPTIMIVTSRLFLNTGVFLIQKSANPLLLRVDSDRYSRKVHATIELHYDLIVGSVSEYFMIYFL